MLSIHCKSHVKSCRSQKRAKTKHFINKYNWDRINLSSEKDDWYEFEKNAGKIALSVLYAKKEKMYSANLSKHNSNCEQEVILLMIPNGEGWNYLSAKKQLALLRRITSKHSSDFCLNFLHSLAIENKCESHKRICETKNVNNILMPSEDTKILGFN